MQLSQFFSAPKTLIVLSSLALVTPRLTLGQSDPAASPDDAQLFDAILSNTRYDHRVPPKNSNGKGGVVVKTSVYVYFMGRFEAERLEYEMQLMIRHRWTDPRLSFRNSNMSLGQNWLYDSLEGESWFTDRIWTPNIFIENEQSSKLTELLRSNIFVRIGRVGNVQMNYRVTTTVLCNMALQRFPHDRQGCSLKLESWTLNSNDMVLEWEPRNPVEINDFILPEYSLMSFKTFERLSCYSEGFPSPRYSDEPRISIDEAKNGSMCSATSKNYSTIQVSFVLQRQVGHYFLDYYIPSILLVAMSWVAFWLDPSAVPGRTTLGTATWLTFITLTHNTGNDQLPKVSYIKYLDVWFLGCTVFIFCSLLEFAIVNTISRQKRTVSVKNFSAKNILKGAATVLKTPIISRKSAPVTPSIPRRKSDNVLNMSFENVNQLTTSTIDNQLSVRSMDDMFALQRNHETTAWDNNQAPFFEFSIPVPRTPPHQNGTPNQMGTPNLSEDEENDAKGPLDYFKDMSSEEIALWIDGKARFLFPACFILFNLGYWFFAFRLDCLIGKACEEVDSHTHF